MCVPSGTVGRGVSRPGKGVGGVSRAGMMPQRRECGGTYPGASLILDGVVLYSLHVAKKAFSGPTPG
jgi:hypothetical protein